jgi:hypothetical protein
VNIHNNKFAAMGLLCDKLAKHFKTDIRLYFGHLSHLKTLRGHDYSDNRIISNRLTEMRFAIERETSQRKAQKQGSDAIQSLPVAAQEKSSLFEITGNNLYDLVARTWHNELYILTFFHKVE